MRWLALLLLFPVVALAQPTCWPSQAGGSGSALVFKVDSQCYAYGWRCTGQRHIVSGAHSAFVSNWREVGLSLMTGTDAERTAAWTQYMTSNATPTGCANAAQMVRVQLYAEYLASVKPAVSYVVSPAASNANPAGTRPAFPFSGGVRGTVSNGRATSGQPCDCSARVGDFCGVNGRTDQVASCTAQ